MTTALKLDKILASSRDENEIVASHGSKKLRWSEFTQNCSRYIQRFNKLPKGAWALHNSDAYEFACQLIALWQLGNTVYLAADTQAVSLQRLEKKVIGFIGDFPRQHRTSTEEHRLGGTPNSSDHQDIAMVIFTSGSSGEPSEVPIRLAQFEAEAATLESQFGHLVQGCSFASTVSHQHLYGLTFSLLWPLLYKREFPCQRVHYLDELPTAFEHHKKTVLISTPSHLSRLPPNVDKNTIHHSSQVVLSSTAALTAQDSKAAREYFQAEVIEIYGSSETGAIAWRNQAEQPLWAALPGIKISNNNNKFKIKSPHSFSANWQNVNDEIEIADTNTFRLIGRRDRIAKVEGVRVSLNAIETRICELDSIIRAKVISINSTGGLGAVIEVKPSVVLSSQSRRALTAKIKQHLLKEFVLPTIPKKWRFMERLPEDMQGKVRMSDLESLFPRKESKQ
ncbi:class I adenylate-forming enzyme family protein [uncultured Pseudoteredinibacter sp.]|uniref:AMP-binding protein n=1 Tax=uncultured Pseudoteredinibacter sp. TaxID=1641701 RepID=UPI002628F38E|nr:class I adenylate-forming enzyme family protein [uncultured Pseudoteredinibacter sp.]